jgi:hypothetical protein
MSKTHTHVPDEVIQLIFQYIRYDLKLLNTLVLVSKEFYDTFSNDKYWRPILASKYKDGAIEIKKNYRFALSQLNSYMKTTGKLHSTNTIRMSVIGGGAVGKSTITIQYVQRIFIDEYDPTMYVNIQR